jgi:hypothetical protein
MAERGAARWISSQQDIPANHSQPPEHARAKTTSATYGRTSDESSTSAERRLCSIEDRLTTIETHLGIQVEKEK